MSTFTLTELQKIVQNDLVSGVIENIIDVNPMNMVLPYTGYAGTGIITNYESTLGDTQFLAIDGTITAKAPSTATTQTFTATTIVGDAEVNGLIAAQGSAIDIMAAQVKSKAKDLGRKFQTGMATGDGASPNMNSMHTLCAASQFTTASAGQALSFALLDELLMLVTMDTPDFIVMPKRTFSAFRALYRAASMVQPDYLRDQFGKSAGLSVMEYLGIPVFRNDFLSVVETANGAALAGGALTSVYAGVWDDGTMSKGLAAIHPAAVPGGVVVEAIGNMETKDTNIVRVKQYVNLANFGVKGLARLTSINN